MISNDVVKKVLLMILLESFVLPILYAESNIPTYNKTFAVPYIYFMDSSFYSHLDTILHFQEVYTKDRDSGRYSVFHCNVIKVASRRIMSKSLLFYLHIVESNYFKEYLRYWDYYLETGSPYMRITGYFEYNNYLFAWYGDLLDNMVVKHDRVTNFLNPHFDLSTLSWYEYDVILNDNNLLLLNYRMQE